jgi:hypothetical protein
MFKLFTTRFGTNNLNKIQELRKEFPGMSFASGNHKGTSGIWCLQDTVNRQYGEKFEMDNGDIFFLPTSEKLQEIKDNLSKFKTLMIDRIPVKLKCGVTIEIYPASAIPQKVMLSLRRKQTKVEEESAYNKSVAYGRMAFDHYFKSQNNEEVRFDSEEFQNFMRQALIESYTLPIEIWDAMELICLGDFDPIFCAAMGYNYDMLLKELPLSNGG